MAWASELPKELLCRPTGLVVLTGLDVTYNAVHKSIWDSFCNNRRADRVPLHFKVLTADHEYPKSKVKKTSYEWYIPKGIMKVNWMRKHLTQIPAVVVIFFDLDWNETMWKERQMECSTRLQIVRDSLAYRNTRLCVVLIQKNAPLPPGEDVVAAERAASFCSACELSAKSLFVLPHTDHLYGYTIRLENAFYEQAQSYYHTEARRVKSHKEFLNKTTHQLLFVRHQIKIAFFNEMKQDTHTALKHYKQAYGHILELRMNNTHLLEVKVVAGYINYKICRLSFQHNAPLDAISQFRKHIDFFREFQGTSELAFEHSAWISKQFQVFGDLFDEAIKSGLTAIQTQHPGFYYQLAASHAINRKKLCRGLCHTHDMNGEPLEGLHSLEFYGQRPWRQGYQSIDPPDQQKEKDGILALQNLELLEDHSIKIIPLLNNAVAQFKKYKSPRMKRSLMVQMGEEYYHAKEYTKALSLLTRVTWDYRQERWWHLLTSILITALRCSYLVGNAQEYVTICLELIGQHVKCSPEEKTRIQMNLIRVMCNNHPEAEPGCDADCVEKAKALWKCELHESFKFNVDMQTIIPFVECKARFVSDKCAADSQVELQVFLRTHCEFPIRFSKLKVFLDNKVYSEHCVVSDDQEDTQGGDLYLIPNKVKTHSFTFLPLPTDVGKEIKIKSINIVLGCEGKRCAILQWEGGGGDALPTTVFTEQASHWSSQEPPTEHAHWDHIKVTDSISIVPRSSKLELTLSHSAPVLVNEFYPIRINIKNTELACITQVSLSLWTEQLSEEEDNLTHMCIGKAERGGDPQPKASITLGDILTDNEASSVAYIDCLNKAHRTVHVRVTYHIDVDVEEAKVSCTCFKDEVLQLDVIEPFSLKFRLQSLLCEQIETIHADEPFLLIPELECTSLWPVDVSTSSLVPSPFIKTEDLESQLTDLSLEEDESAEECYYLVAPPCITPSIPLGTYSVHWRRRDSSDNIPYVTTTVTIPPVNIEHIPLYIDVDLPAHGTVRNVFPARYNVHNRTAYIQEIEVTMETNDTMMFAGHKQVHFRVLPNDKHVLQYNFIPLVPGNVALPKLNLNMLRYPGTMNQLVQKMLPTHVFVMPKSKS